MKLVILSQYWSPETGAPQTRLGELATRLAGKGWDVSVITAQPNYPTGRVFPGYSKFWWSHDSYRGIPVLRCPLLPDNSKKTLRRIACYLSFVVSASIAGTIGIRKNGVLLVESPPLFLAIAARMVSRIRGCQYVFNVSDLWPDSAVEMGWVAEGRGVWLARALERWAYEGATGLCGQSPSIVANLVRRAPGKPVHLLTNGVDVSRFDGAGADASWRESLGVARDDVLVLYVGLHGVAQGLGQLLDVAARLRCCSGLKFCLVGDGAEKSALREMASELDLDNVIFCDPVPRENVPGLLKAADIAFVPLGFALTGAVPSKIYEAMAARLPIIFVGEGDGRALLARADAGICCDIGDGPAIDAAIRLLMRDPGARAAMGSRGRELVGHEFDREVIAEQFAEFLRSIDEGCHGT